MINAGGGTEIYQPLKDVFNQPIPEGRSRQVFLLTDGEVSNGKRNLEGIFFQINKNLFFFVKCLPKY